MQGEDHSRGGRPPDLVGEVVEAHLPKPPNGRPDAAILEMKDLGGTVFYGG
jgi:hypothetical protein